MKLCKVVLSACILMHSGISLAGDIFSSYDRAEVRYITNNKRMPDLAYQAELRNGRSWQLFLKTNPTWYVVFNEENRKPHKAFGSPILVSGSDAKSRALNFISTYLGSFEIPLNELSYKSTSSSGSYEYVHFNQRHMGLEVQNTHVIVKMTHDGWVVQFGLDIYNDITIGISPALSAAEAMQNAKTGITNTILNTTVSPVLTILPVPENKKNIYKLVYEVTVETIDAGQIPANYYTLVDAGTGNVVYRFNTIKHFNSKKQGAANTDVNVTGTVYPTNPFSANAVMPLVNMKMVANSTTSYTDNLGYIGLTNSSSVSATFYLEGRWSKVRTNSITPSFIGTLNPGTNNISFNSNANIRERSAYYHVNIVHDYLKTKFPSFTAMDYALQTNVDMTGGNCNAFYSGTSINFYATGNGCNCLAQVGDVVYHEYGHGINHEYYGDLGTTFNNGAMDEGYADIWALGITASPVLGIGMDITDPNKFVRRYDINKKVYPQDILGEVHSDGEIIAGAWWDLGLNLGNLQQMMDLFKETFNALVRGPNGTEGQVYLDVLIEALQADDVVANGGDNNIVNGTPNDNDIIDAFALHGITLLSNANVNHTPVKTSAAIVPITISANISMQYAWALTNAKMFYKINTGTSWNTVLMTNGSGNTYSAVIPAQPPGTIIAYYLGLEDAYGKFSSVLPFAANETNPNIPYFIMNGFSMLKNMDFDFDNSVWTTGVTGDNASTGTWITTVPVPSYLTFGDPSSIVQPDTQVTSGGGLACAVTANATLANDPPGTSDIDDGQTTLETPVLDLSSYINPAISFYRWYSNNMGANPANDTWDVLVSPDGSNWTKVEQTNVSDRSWRRYAFRVSDYITPSSTTYVRFVAEDSLMVGSYLDGGSLVEAAVDDVMIWEQDNSATASINDIKIITTLIAYPNPAKSEFTLSFNLSTALDNVKVDILNNLGQVVESFVYNNVNTGFNKYRINTQNVPAGMYTVNLKARNQSSYQKITILQR